MNHRLYAQISNDIDLTAHVYLLLEDDDNADNASTSEPRQYTPCPLAASVCITGAADNQSCHAGFYVPNVPWRASGAQSVS